jgi:hypothetical protein
VVEWQLCTIGGASRSSKKCSSTWDLGRAFEHRDFTCKAQQQALHCYSLLV